MKVGDLVKNGQGHIGIVVGIGYMGTCPSYDKSPFPNPDIQVLTARGSRSWSYKAMKVISERR